MNANTELHPEPILRGPGVRGEGAATSGPHAWREAPGRELGKRKAGENVGRIERLASLGVGLALASLGLARRGVTGALVAGDGGALAYRGATGKCGLYQRLGIDTAATGKEKLESSGVHVVESLLIDKPREELYRYWRELQRLPSFMTHLKEANLLDEDRSEWVAKAPFVVGGEVRWQAQILTDEPNERIAWESLPGSDIENSGSLTFADLA